MASLRDAIEKEIANTAGTKIVTTKQRESVATLPSSPRVHAGLRENGDFVSIGRYAVLEAKLGDARQANYKVFLGAVAHSMLFMNCLYASGNLMWDGPRFLQVGGERKPCYQSTFGWRI